MARKYRRDNKGRFAGGGGGATARGGRLKTASGNKRKTQTMQSSAAPKSTIGKPKGLKPGAIKPKPQVSSARQAATDRLKIKTATRRKLRANRESVIPSTPAGPKTMRAQRVGSTIPKSIARTKGNEPAKVARRIDRKAAVNAANLKNITQAERIGATQGRQYQRAIKSSLTLKRAKEFSNTGKLPGRDNSMAFKRQIKKATARINEKRAARTAAAKPARAAAKPAATKGRKAKVGKIDEAKAGRIIQRHDAMRPGMRPGTGSLQRSMNSINTFRRARKFLLEPSRKVAKKGETISGQESIRRAVAGASQKFRSRK